MKALIQILRTTLAGVVFLGAFGVLARAEEAGSRSRFRTDGLLPDAAAVIVPSNERGDQASFPANSPTIGQLSGSDFRPAHGVVERAGHDSRWGRQWAISLVPLFASEVLDASSSYGMRELNPLLAGSNGGFGMKATVLKFGVVGALAGAEYFVVRKHPASAKFFTIVNWATAGATSGLAVHNYARH